MEPSSMRTIFINSMKNSSVKGLPRIISAQSVGHRALWIIAVVALSTVCALSVLSNIQTFLNYPKVMNVEEKMMSHVDAVNTAPFPTVSVCNMNPFGSNDSVFDIYGITRPGQYYRWANDITNCPKCLPEQKAALDLGKRKLLTNRGYYQYVGREAMAQVGNHHFVLRCVVHVASASTTILFPCEDYTRHSTFLHPDFGICHAYEVILSQSYMVWGFTFTLHLDSSENNVNRDYEPFLHPQPNSGTSVFALNPFTVPHFTSAAAAASPGKATSVYLKVIRTDRLSKPYSERACLQDDSPIEYTFQNKTYSYDHATCFGRCNIAYVQEACNCTDLFVAQNPEDSNPELDYCLSSQKPIGDIFKESVCAEVVKHKAAVECSNICKEPCKEIKYTMATATTHWPLPSQIASFYNKIIEPDPILRTKYGKHSETAKAMYYGWDNVTETQKMQLTKVVDENFALVYFVLSDLYYTHFEAQPKITFDAFISQLGGSLNLWSGITVVLIVEIIDLILRLVDSCTKHSSSHNKVQQQHRVGVSNPQYETKFSSDDVLGYK